ncbi:Nicotinamidase-related amidase [Sphingomonas gellani]|uniref:Nicotinamidase-related amidase n=1 Tax=Sphingomonas gellani TaxID=1166340 RepID=A0A1H8B9P1_9SPHN|nr:hydrolase [Sphingomonas gellani]SEM79582.1 Nicotinamidase-related amidase [Sphingomonas gellani]
MTSLDPRTTALILIDLQQGIATDDKAPRTGAEVVGAAKALATRFRQAGAPVVLVHVAFAPGSMPSQKVDKPGLPPEGTPAAFSEFVHGLREADDIVVLKRHWGAFTGTDLDLQLRRRGVRTVVIGGIATHMGVESTARSAWELSYDVVIAEDVTSAMSAETHRFAVETIFPQIARVSSADAIVLDRP